MKKPSKCLLIIVFALGALFVIIPSLIYFIHFHQSLSDHSDQWAYFGEYLNPFIATANFIVISYLTYRAYIISINAEAPVIRIATLAPKISIYNISSYTAFNVRVVIHYDKQEDDEAVIDNLVPSDSIAFDVPANYSLATGVTVFCQNSHGKEFKYYPNYELRLLHIFKLSDKEINNAFNTKKNSFVELLQGKK